MNRQGSALFEAPLAHEATQYTNSYVNSEYHETSEFELAWEQPNSNCPTYTSVVISRFHRYQQSVAALPSEEKMKIIQIGDMVVRSFKPGCFPITKITIVGHADRDVRRGPKFEVDISKERATAVKRALNIVINTRQKGLVGKITVVSGGVGAKELVVPNARTERQQALNRRVVVTLEPNNQPVPPPFNWRDAARRGLNLLKRSFISPNQKNRLTCLLQKVLEPGVVDAYVIYTWEIQQQVAPLPAKQLLKFLQHLKVDLGKRDNFGPTVSDVLFMDNLVQLDVAILYAIDKLNEQVHQVAPDRFKLQLWRWILDRQRDPKSIYWCYGKGQQ